MENWFECKVKYEKIDEFGKQAPVSESYMVDALSFTEAESRLFKLLEGEVPAEFIVIGIAKAKLNDVVPAENADYWYKCKVIYKDIDEKSGKEKSIGNQILVAAGDFNSALENLEKSLDTMLVPWEIHQISLTKVVDVFPYNDSDEGKVVATHVEPLSETDENYIENDID